ncbi:hypothetical protein KO116_P100329 (plasmid) [Halomonas sp. KO116]|nr:hypothetical protein KO116_P100329 [Halomonas sp. KO116]
MAHLLSSTKTKQAKGVTTLPTGHLPQVWVDTVGTA